MKSQLAIILLTLLVEGLLFIIAVGWFLYIDHAWPIFSYMQIVHGFLYALPLLALNFLLISMAKNDQGVFSKQLKEFNTEVIVPLVNNLSFSTIIIISLCAGIGEEFFFRGLLQNELGWLIANILFAVLHFGTAVKKYYLIVIIYFIFGCYFSLLAPTPDNLWLAVSCHAWYDFIAILTFKHFIQANRL